MEATATIINEKRLHEKIQEALDGRPVTWLQIRTLLNYTELTRKVKGDVIIRQPELDLINDALGTSFILD